MTPYYQDDWVTIYHGDAVDVMVGLPDESVDAIVTDPPYKISQTYSASVDSDNVVAVASLWPVAAEALRIARPGALCVLYYDTRLLPFALGAMRGSGWKYLRALTLYRRWGVASKLHGWMSSSDFVLVFVKPGSTYSFHSHNVRHDVYVRDKPDPHYAGHPAQKPYDATRHIVENICPAGGVVLDPYLGSGTSALVAREIGRKAIGIEIEERYCEIAAKRCAQEVLDLGGVA